MLDLKRLGLRSPSEFVDHALDFENNNLKVFMRDKSHDWLDGYVFALNAVRLNILANEERKKP